MGASPFLCDVALGQYEVEQSHLLSCTVVNRLKKFLCLLKILENFGFLRTPYMLDEDEFSTPYMLDEDEFSLLNVPNGFSVKAKL